MKYSGGTFSGTKAVVIAEEITVVGHRCTPQGRLPELSRIAKIVKWGPCTTLSDVRAFLGTIGVARIFIKDFAKIANPLTHLTKKGVEFFFGSEQIDAQEKLKQALIDSLALRPLDYDSDALIILAVDTSSIAVGFFLCQAESENPKI